MFVSQQSSLFYTGPHTRHRQVWFFNAKYIRINKKEINHCFLTIKLHCILPEAYPCVISWGSLYTLGVTEMNTNELKFSGKEALIFLAINRNEINHCFLTIKHCILQEGYSCVIAWGSTLGIIEMNTNYLKFSGKEELTFLTINQNEINHCFLTITHCILPEGSLCHILMLSLLCIIEMNTNELKFPGNEALIFSYLLYSHSGIFFNLDYSGSFFFLTRKASVNCWMSWDS